MARIDLDSPDPNGNATEIGTGWRIGDGVVLTAGHVVYEFNEKSALADRSKVTLSGTDVFWDPRTYGLLYDQKISQLGETLPTPSSGQTVTTQYIEVPLRSSDMMLISRSGNVGKNDAGLAVYLDQQDLLTTDNGLTNGTVLSRDGRMSQRDQGHALSVGNGGYIFDKESIGGDSGGANLLNFDDKDFVIGNTVSTNTVRHTTFSTLFSYNEFIELNRMLATTQTGNVTGNEPMNMVIGSSSADANATGTYRPDKILGKGGNDNISDGDTSTAWGNDELYGGEGDDNFKAGRGDDLIEGGDFRIYGSGNRVAIEDDGLDTIDYSNLSSTSPDKGIRVSLLDHSSGKTNVLMSQTFKTVLDASKTGADSDGDYSRAIFVADLGRDKAIDTVVSVEKIIGTDAVDILEIQSLSADLLAGSDGKGGLASVDLKGGATVDVIGDTIDLSKLNESAKVDLRTTATSVLGSGGYVSAVADGARGFLVSNAERVLGTAQADAITGDEHDNEFFGRGGDDVIKGGAGLDVAGYDGTSAQYKVTQGSASGFTISQSGGALSDGVDDLTDIEQVRFADTKGDLLRFGVTAGATSVTEGDTLSLKVSADRADGKGVSEDVWVYLKPVGSATKADFESQNESPPPAINPTAAASAAISQEGGFWVKIPAGKSAATLNLVAKVDEKEPTQTAKFTIAAYLQLVDDKDRGKVLDSPVRFDLDAINQNAPSVDVKNKDTSLSLSEDGGYEGFGRVVDVAADTEVTFSFEAYDVPDFLKIWDPKTGQIYVDSNFMSGGLTNSFTTAPNASGRLQVAIMTNNTGTLWNLSVNAGIAGEEGPGIPDFPGFPGFPGPGPVPTAQMNLRFAASSLDGPGSTSDIDLSFGSLVVSAGMRWSDVEENNVGSGNRVFLSRSGDLTSKLSIGWRLEGEGSDAVDGDDFGGSLPQGVVDFDAGTGTAQFSFSTIAGDDDVLPEGYHIVFFDPSTGEAISGLDNGPAALTGRVVSPSETLLKGTSGNDVLIGADADNVILAEAGDDIITSDVGDDWIDGGAGNDVLDGGLGSDRLVGGEGSDTYVFRSDANDFSRDTIEDYGATTDIDTLDLGDFGDLTPFVSAEGNDLLISNPITLQTIRIAGQLDGDGIEAVTFSSRGQTVNWTRDDLSSLAGLQIYHFGDGNQTIDATNANYGSRLIISSDVPDDALTFSRTFDSPETLFIDVSDGSRITIYGLFSSSAAGGFTGIVLPSGAPLTISDLENVAPLRGTDYGDYFISLNGNERIAGGLGDDTLFGLGGSDTYEYTIGDGGDTVIDTRGTAGDENTLRLIGILPQDISGIRVDNSILLTLPDGGSILLDGQLGRELPQRDEQNPVAGGVSSVVFDDGTIWDAEAIKTAIGFVAPRPAPVGTDGDDVLIGDYWNDDISGGAGNDQIDGGDGDDNLYGDAGDDTLRGGAGNDLLVDDGGADSVNAGEDDDVILAGSADSSNDQLDGGLGNDTLNYSSAMSPVTFDFVAGTASSLSSGIDTFTGIEQIIGTTGDDTFVLGGDFISIQGGNGSDSYVLAGEGAGTTTIVEFPFATGTNELTLRDLNPNDVTISFIPSSYFSATVLQIMVKTTGAIIDVPSDFVMQDADGNKVFGIGSLRFADGTVWNSVELSNAAWIRGTDNDDVIDNSEASDTIDAGKGDDFIKFGGGSDRIIYRTGDGSDTLQIGNFNPESPAILDMVDLDRDDVSLARSGNSLQIAINSTGEKITISDQFTGYGITNINFSNGEVLGTADIVAQAVIAPVVGTDGDDYLRGTDAAERIDGGLGNDTLYGGAGSDTYTYRKGDGSDLILDYNSDYEDILDLTDLSQDDVRFTTDGSRMLVTVIPTGDVITLRDFSYAPESIDVFRFSDGSILTRDQVLAIADKISGTSGDDVLVGTGGSDRFFGLDGNDTMSSSQGDDTYTGGRGDDIIRSGFGGDTYLWSKGDGNDRIEDFVAYGPSDSLVLADVASSGVSLSRTSEGDLLVTVNETGEVITVAGQYESPTDTGIGIDYIQFDNGEYWWREQIAEASAPIVEVNGTDDADTLRGSRYKEVFLAGAGDDWINGREGDDILVGGTGNDTLGGAAGNDIYRFARGDGQDTIVDGIDYWDGGNGGNDTIELGAGFTPDQVTVSQQLNGNDLLLDFGQGDSIYIGNAPLSDGGNTIEQVKFDNGMIWTAADLFAQSITATAGDDSFRGTYSGETISGGAGNDWVSARGGNDVLIGGTGNDTLGGGAGDDTYRFARGDGRDTIVDGIDYWDGGNGGTDTIELGAGFTPDQVTVSQQSNGHDLLLDFGQGDSIYIGNAPITDGGNIIEQVKFADGTVWSAADLFARSITPTAGDDNFRGTYGGETIAGGAGNDWINGRGGHDIIIGGTGNDAVGGGGGDDTYRFARGDGQDTILDGIDYWDGDNGGNDTIELGVGFTPGQVTVSQQSNGHDLLLNLGQGDSIYIGNSPITDGGNTIEQVNFVDGTVWSAADLFARSIIPTAGDDNFRGTYGGETIAGGAGNDWINGRGGNDIIIGGSGNDTVGGGGGDDTYRFARGDGQDTILDGIDYWDGDNGGNDTIELGVGFTPGQVTVSQQSNGHDLLLDLGQGDSIYIGNAPITDGGNTIEQVTFADGTVWSAADLFARSVATTAGDDNFRGTYGDETIAGGAGNDWINGRGGNDIIAGGTGNDTLGGGSGDDTYRFARGDGQDTILDGIDYWDGGNGGNDTIELGAGITPDQVIVSQQSNGNDLLLDFGQGDSIYIGNAPVTDGGNTIEQVMFADGTVWSASDLISRSTLSSSFARSSDEAFSQNEAVAYSAGNPVTADNESSTETRVRSSGRHMKMRSYDEQADPYGSVRRVQVAAAQLIEASATFGTRSGAFMTDVQNNKSIASIADIMALDQRDSFNARHEMT